MPPLKSLSVTQRTQAAAASKVSPGVWPFSPVALLCEHAETATANPDANATTKHTAYVLFMKLPAQCSVAASAITECAGGARFLVPHPTSCRKIAWCTD